METVAPWKAWKTNCMFSTLPTALGKLGTRRRVSPSSHSLCGWILIEEKRKEMLPHANQNRVDKMKAKA
jgi:hypothetical protein